MQNKKKDITFKNILCYGIGDFGGAAIWSYISTFLMFFYTDIFKVPALTVSLLFLLARLWDGVTDVALGVAADRTKTRWGRYRPYLIFVPPFGTAMLLLTFWAHPEWTQSAKTLYVYVTYFLVVLAFTSTDVPYGSLPSAITKDPVKRGHLTTARLFFSILASVALSIFVVPIVESYGPENAQRGYLVVGAAVALVYCLGYWITAAGVREGEIEDSDKPKISFVKQIVESRKNLPFIIAIIGQFMFGFIYYGKSSTYMYYYTYVEENVMLMSLFSLISLVPYLVGNLSFPALYKVVKNKGRVGAYAFFGAAVSLGLLSFFTAGENMAVFTVLMCVQAFCLGLISTCCFAVVADAVEYGELQTGIRNDAFQYSVASLGNKVGMAVSTSAFVAVLGVIGYVENQAQTETVLAFIKGGFSWIPAILCLIGGFVMMRYNITKDSFADILKQLEEKKQQEV